MQKSLKITPPHHIHIHIHINIHTRSFKIMQMIGGGGAKFGVPNMQRYEFQFQQSIKNLKFYIQGGKQVLAL